MTCPSCGAHVDPQPYMQTDPGRRPHSFCILRGQNGWECGKIIIGVHGGIYPECVELASEIIRSSAETPPPAHLPTSEEPN